MLNTTRMDILHLKNISWKGAFAPEFPSTDYFDTTIPVPDEPVTHYIEEPVFVIHTLHSCYAHAVIDEIAAYFPIIQSLPLGFRVCIRRENIEKYPEQNLPLISDTSYKGVWKSLIEILSPLPPIFEHTLDANAHYKFKDCYFYPQDDRYQRSIWNCEEYYAGRGVLLKDVVYSDSVVYANLESLRQHVLKDIILEPSKILLIERKNDRRFDPGVFSKLHYYCSLSLDYDGPSILEDMTFEEQVILFSSAKVVIFRHGSCLTNLLWVPKGTLVFDLDVRQDRKSVVGRLCKLTDSIHHYLDYSSFDVQKDIFDHI